ncbi:MAG: ABC transporter ATP-binding protein [Phycisphaerales bacterium]|nr:ABC transporter ATP-binding protein [Phycisphaerales bacterium]
MLSTPPVDSLSHALRLSGVTFSYAQGFSIAIPDLHVAAGEQILLAGTSGSGKSTLLHLIAGLEDARSGEIEIHGTNFTALRGAARDTFRGRHLGMIFQTLNLLQGFSARENVMLALMLAGHSTLEQSTRADRVLAQLGITESHRLVETLSVGQQQRVAVARAVAGNPSLVLADEPTASLDPENARTAIALIQSAAKSAGAALIVTSHDPLLRSAFSRVIEVCEFTSKRVAT